MIIILSMIYIYEYKKSFFKDNSSVCYSWFNIILYGWQYIKLCFDYSFNAYDCIGIDSIIN